MQSSGNEVTPKMSCDFLQTGRQEESWELNELVLCVKDDKSPSTGRKLSCQQRQTGWITLRESNYRIDTLGSNSDLWCDGLVTIDQTLRGS